MQTSGWRVKVLHCYISPNRHTCTNTHARFSDQDTCAIDSRDLEVIYQLNYHVLVGVTGVTLSYLSKKIMTTV